MTVSREQSQMSLLERIDDNLDAALRKCSTNMLFQMMENHIWPHDLDEEYVSEMKNSFTDAVPEEPKESLKALETRKRELDNQISELQSAFEEAKEDLQKSRCGGQACKLLTGTALVKQNGVCMGIVRNVLTGKSMDFEIDANDCDLSEKLWTKVEDGTK